jgi:phage terminase Nu1 subunit (DNA packaging protein)
MNKLLKTNLLDRTMIIKKSQAAQMLGLSRQRISQLIAEGIAIEADGGINAVLTARNYVRRLNKKEASRLPEGLPSLDESKARKEAALCEIEEIKLASLRMELIDMDSIKNRQEKITCAISLAMAQERDQLPALLAGLSASQIAAVLDERAHDMLERLADPRSEFWQR